MAVNLGGVIYDVDDRLAPDVVVIEHSQVVLLDAGPAGEELVVVERAGPRGAPGPQGPVGPKGDPWRPYRHTQNVASESWLIQHGFGYHPTIFKIFDSDGVETDPEVTHLSPDVSMVTFSEPTAGTADVF